MQIRRATEKDYEAYIKLSQTTYYSMELKGSLKPNTINANVFILSAKGREQERFNNYANAGNIIIAEENEKMIAFAVVVIEWRVCKIFDFVVASEYQGKGKGTSFAKYIIKEAKKKNRAKKSWLCCEFDGAKVFWEKLGFKERANGIFEKIL